MAHKRKASDSNRNPQNHTEEKTVVLKSHLKSLLHKKELKLNLETNQS